MIETHTTPGIEPPPVFTPPLPKTPKLCILRVLDMRARIYALQLLLHDLRTAILRRIAHHFGLIDRGLATISRVRAIRSALSAAFDEDMSLFVQLASTNIYEQNLPPIATLRIGNERTFNASLREKLFSQCPQGNGFTAKWIRLWRFRS